MRYNTSLNSQWFQNSQPSKLEEQKNVRLSKEIKDFFVFQLWRPEFLEPLGVQRHTVPHFKGLIELYLDLQAQGRDSTFTICHALVKRAILHYIKACGRFVFSTTVAPYLKA